jgi:quinol monooxygenase YgiN
MAEPHAAQADDSGDGAAYVVAYVEVMPPSTAEAAELLRHYREASRTDAGLVRLEVLQQRDRPDHFAIVETWQDQQSFEAHASAPHTRTLHERLQPLRCSPYDERLHQGFSLGSAPASGSAGAIYTLTHADAVPPAKDDAMAALKQLAEASRCEDGGLGFEVLQQRRRLNHFTIVEVWRDERSVEAHAMAAHTRQFREQFQPMSGSLYDERLYQALY